MLAIPAGPRIDQLFTGNLTQSKSVIEFPEGKEASVRRNLGTVKFQLQPTVKIEPYNPGFAFTRRVSHQTLSMPRSTF